MIYLEILGSAIIFVLILINIACNQKKKNTSIFTGAAALISGFGGLILYGYGFTQTQSNLILAIARTLYATLNMFLGKNEYSAISKLEVMQTTWVAVIFWIMHLLALYATTNAVLATLGARVLKRIRVFLNRGRGQLTIIFGINRGSISFGKELVKDREKTVMFIDRHVTSGDAAALDELGCLYFTTGDAVNSDKSFFQRVGIKNGKKIDVYAMHVNEMENISYASSFRDTCASMDIRGDEIRLTALANMETSYGDALKMDDKKHGFGSVLIVDRAYLAAHALLENYPVYHYVKFDTEKGKAAAGSSFHAVIIGFAKMGQAVLKNLVIHSQFEGCEFKATVFDPRYESTDGYLYQNSKPMLEHYDIHIRKDNAQGREFYKFVKENIENIDYVVICTGDEEVNAEIYMEILGTLKHFGGHADVFQCAYNGIITQEQRENRIALVTKPVYTKKLLDIDLIDRRAMELNHIYTGGISAIKDWNSCAFLGQMSSRASADFSASFMKLVGMEEKDLLADPEKWKTGLSEEQYENLSKTEHLRWCAFYYSMGYETMPADVYDDRCNRRKNGEQLKIQEDKEKRLHACLVDWDELDAITEKYVEATGEKGKDFKADDTNNVKMLPELIKASAK